jgi:L-cysteine desulfidase
MSMQKTDEKYQAYVRVLERQLKPAMGCTEPIAIAYAAALCRSVLGMRPEKVSVLVSGNILKNAKAVTVPGTGGRKGIEAACAAGIVAGDESRELQVIAQVSEPQREEISAYLAGGAISVALMPDARVFDIRVDGSAAGHTASVRIADRHTNVVQVQHDGAVLTQADLPAECAADDPTKRCCPSRTSTISRTPATWPTWPTCLIVRSPATRPSPGRASAAGGARAWDARSWTCAATA